MKRNVTFDEKAALYDAQIVNYRKLDSDESDVIATVINGSKRKYRIFCWGMKGQLSLNSNTERYAELCRKHEVLRRRYFYMGMDEAICVTFAFDQYTFPIMDLRNETELRQKAIIENITSAEARGIYKPEEDSVLKIRVFITGNDKIIVLMKAYMQFGLPMTPFDIRRFVFWNMKIDSESDFTFSEEKLEIANEELEKRCTSYWKTKLKAVDKPVIIPFESSRTINNSELYTIDYELDETLLKNLTKYKDTNSTSISYILMREWGALFGEYSETKHPLLTIRHGGSMMQAMPMVIDLEADIKDCYGDLLVQDNQYQKNCFCHFSDVMSVSGVNLDTFFDVLFEIVQKEESVKTTDILKSIYGSDNTYFSPKLNIRIAYGKEGVCLRYTYDSGVLSDKSVSMLHESYITALSERIAETKKFNWKDYIEECRSQEEKLEKIEIAQKALYIKDSNLIHIDESDELIAVSKAGHVGNYIVEDVVYEAGNSISQIGILVSGHLEERYEDADGMVKTISLYKPGYVFGAESITGTNKNPFSLVAADSVKIMWIATDSIFEVSSKNPQRYDEFMKEMLNRTINETNRIKKLWVLD